jgi:hypothetical protein
MWNLPQAHVTSVKQIWSVSRNFNHNFATCEYGRRQEEDPMRHNTASPEMALKINSL